MISVGRGVFLGGGSVEADSRGRTVGGGGGEVAREDTKTRRGFVGEDWGGKGGGEVAHEDTKQNCWGEALGEWLRAQAFFRH